MKRQLKIIIGVSAASVLVFSALAQDSSTPKIGGSESTSQRMSRARAEQLNDAAKASDIIGMAVKNYQNEKLGTVKDLAVDVESGRIVQVILSTGGFIGMGTTLRAVPPTALDHNATNKFLYLDISKDKFNMAPQFDASAWDADKQSNQVVQVYNYYGEQPYFVADRDGYATTNMDGTYAATLPKNMDGTINTTGARTVDTAHNAEVASNVEATNEVITTQNADGTSTREYRPTLRAAGHSWSRLGYVQKASSVMGMPVKNLQNEKIGEVENLMIDLSSGRIVVVIISAGGYMGMADELSAVPPVELRLNDAHDTLQLDASREMLVNSPHFAANQWPDFSQSRYATGVYDAYNVRPYFNTEATAKPDNTGRNVRDRDSQTLTPLDQGNSQADINITAQIRKEIIANDNMSMNAKNVKIMTLNGHVTLRGPVNNEDEKVQIGEIANRIAQAGNVDNQLEVKLATTSSNN